MIRCICLCRLYLQANGCWAQNAAGTSLLSVSVAALQFITMNRGAQPVVPSQNVPVTQLP